MGSSHFISAETLARRLKDNKPELGYFAALVCWENIVRETGSFMNDKYEDFDLDSFYEMCDYDYLKRRDLKE